MFRVDATELIGGGHVMRCLTLADAIRERGAKTMFVCAAVSEPLEARLLDGGHALEKIPSPKGLERTGNDWHEPPLNRDTQEQDAAASLEALRQPADWMVVDHYLFDSRWHSAARRSIDRVLVIDDLANRRLDCDLLLDETLGRTSEDYAPLIPRDATMLTGALYALLRPEFPLARRRALERRLSTTSIQTILVSLGMTDINGATASVVESLLRQKRDWTIEVVLGECTESFAAIQALAAANAAIRIHVNTNRMAELIANADFAIGASGTSAWERCCLGLPSATMVLASNQALVADALIQAGAAIILPNASEAGEAVLQFLNDAERLSAMSTAAFAVTDGLGTARVVDCILTTENARRASVTG